MTLTMLSALRNPSFRLYWFGFLASIIGFQIQIVGIGYFGVGTGVSRLRHRPRPPRKG